MQMVEAHPFWGYLLLQVRLVPTPTLPALVATDAIRHIWFSPRFTAQLPDDELGFVMTHLLVHQVFAVQQRRGNRDASLWHQAMDHVANLVVAAIPDPANYHGDPLYTPPDRIIEGLGVVTTLLDDRYRRKILESVYEHLKAEQTSQKSGAGDDAKGGGQPDTHGTPVELDVMTDGGSQRVRFQGVLPHGGFDLHLPFTLNAAERETLADRMAEAVEYWTASGQRGDAPGEMLRQLGALATPQIPWQRILQRFLDEALSKSEYSRRSPNRRYIVDDIVVPGLIGEEIEHIVIALDVSGSMQPKQLTAALAEIRALLPYATAVTCIIADAVIQEVLELDGVETLLKQRKFKGGGGTSHIPVFEYIERERLQPIVFIGITDLQSEFPEEKPAYPVLWLVTGRTKAPWGQVIRLD